MRQSMADCGRSKSLDPFGDALHAHALLGSLAYPAFPFVVMLLVANSTPMVDLDSKLNSSRVNLDKNHECTTTISICIRQIAATLTHCFVIFFTRMKSNVLCARKKLQEYHINMRPVLDRRLDLPTPESPISTTCSMN